MYLEFQQTLPKEKRLAHEVPCKPSDAIGAYIFTLNSTNYLCKVDYYSKF